MISSVDIYHVLSATIPSYVVMILAYISVKWWKLFTPDQCSGINKFVANFSIPLLAFQLISENNPYKMNLKLILSDVLQKMLALSVLGLIAKLSKRGSLSWVITGLSLSTLPNTLVLGIPLLKSMYGEEAGLLVAQIVVMQSIVWYNLLLFLLEFDATRGVVAAPSDEAAEEVEASQKPQSKDSKEGGSARKQKTLLILLTVARKLIKNPNTHATVAGVIWASIRFRWGVDLPPILNNSIILLSKGGLGMAMFSIGLFMASQKSIIACGARIAALAMGLKFIIGPSLMALSSIAIGLKGKTLFKVAVVQAALPQAIVPFVFAKEYNVHPDILSTGVIFGMIIAIPITLAYYFLLAL